MKLLLEQEVEHPGQGQRVLLWGRRSRMKSHQAKVYLNVSSHVRGAEDMGLRDRPSCLISCTGPQSQPAASPSPNVSSVSCVVPDNTPKPGLPIPNATAVT